jgi:hypothetical protein
MEDVDHSSKGHWLMTLPLEEYPIKGKISFTLFLLL